MHVPDYVCAYLYERIRITRPELACGVFMCSYASQAARVSALRLQLSSRWHAKRAAFERVEGSARRHSARPAPPSLPPGALAPSPLALTSKKPRTHLHAWIVETFSAPAVPALAGHWRHALRPVAPLVGL